VAHAGLARAIAPATPEAVLLMAEERARHPFWSGFGPLPLVRRMLSLALFSLVTLLGVSISAAVNTTNMSKSVLELSGFPLLMIEAFLVSAASLGACFANLQRINTFISDGTYDPRIQSTYWTRWVMGVISGIVLSQLVYVFYLAHSGNDGTVGTASVAFGQPILALIGGYSVDFVHGILTRAINSVGSFFGVSMAGGADTQPRPGMVEAVAQQRLALASASAGTARALPTTPEIEDLSRHPMKPTGQPSS
jgi:low temperature requirement protein LtrA